MAAAGRTHASTGGRHLPGGLRRALAPESALWAVLMVVVPLVAVGGILILAPVDPDYWWHLATGRWMLAHDRIPRTDPFSWTHGGQTWVAHEWLAELLLAGADRVGGYAAAIVLTAAIAVAGYWLLLDAARMYGLSRRAICLLMLLWGGIALWPVAVRPQLWGFALLCALLWLLTGYATGRPRRLWALPVLFAVWINIHLTALIGIGMLGLFVTGRVLTRRLDWRLFAVSVLCGGALLINPWGPELLRFAFTYANPHALRYQMIDEWARPSPRDPSLIPFWLAAPMVGAALWFGVRRRAIWPAAAVLIAFTAALRAQRYVPLYGLVLVPFAGWIAWASPNQGAPRTATAEGGARLLPRGRVLGAALGAAAAVLAIMAVLPRSEFRRSPQPRGYPAAAAAVAAEQAPETRLFNTYGWGGYLIARLWPDQRVFIDGREEMYGDAFLRGYLDLYNGRPDAAAILAQEGVRAVLVERGAGIARVLAADASWSVAYEDATSILFLPAAPPER